MPPLPTRPLLGAQAAAANIARSLFGRRMFLPGSPAGMRISRRSGCPAIIASFRRAYGQCLHHRHASLKFCGRRRLTNVNGGSRRRQLSGRFLAAGSGLSFDIGKAQAVGAHFVKRNVSQEYRASLVRAARTSARRSVGAGHHYRSYSPCVTMLRVLAGTARHLRGHYCFACAGRIDVPARQMSTGGVGSTCRSGEKSRDISLADFTFHSFSPQDAVTSCAHSLCCSMIFAKAYPYHASSSDFTRPPP